MRTVEMPGKDADAPTIEMPRKGFPSAETSPRDEAGSADSDAPLTPPSPWKWTIALALASAILMVAKPYVTAKPKNDAFVLSATDRNGRIQVRWDPNTTPVKSAQSAVLDVVDGNETHRYPVDAKVLHSGALDYVRNADDATVNLILMRDGQALAQSAVRSVGAVTALPQPPAVSATSHRSRRR